MEYDVVIIGGGVAGLSAGLYSARGGKSTLIIENSNLGGITATLGKIENFPAFTGTGEELVNKLFEQAMSFGVNFEYGDIDRIDFDGKSLILSDGQICGYKALIVASGVTYQKLGIEGENTFKNKGISYCATCDGRLYKDKDVIVVTNGFVAHKDIEYLRGLAKKVYVLDLSEEYVNRAVEIYHGVKIKKIFGLDGVGGIIFERYGRDVILHADGIFICLGKVSDTTLFKEKLTLNGNKIVTDENMHTNIDGVYAVGDIRDKSLRQIVTACSDGAIAGSEAIKYIAGMK